MKSMIKILLAAAFFISGSASADIIDRIDACERSGGSDRCVYSILRELATTSPAQRDDTLAYCQCELSSYNCDRNTQASGGRSLSISLTAYVENLTTGQVTSNRRMTCWNVSSISGSPDSFCQAALERNPRCNVRN